MFFFFFFFCLVFSGVFHFFLNLSKQKSLFFFEKKLSRTFKFFFFESLLNFFGRNIFLMQNKCSKIIIWIFFKKKSPLRKNLFPDSQALRIPCAIESPLDHCCVSWRSWASPVHVHSVVIDLGRGTSVTSSHLSLSFFFCFSVCFFVFFFF